jgi:hypothetical protein
MARNTDAEIDGLYAAPPGEFVQRRDELARSLRTDGDREAADEVKKLRKPSVAAWAVNQLARREKMRLRGLFTAGERLRAAHEHVLAGGPRDDLERARDDERLAIGELAAAARTLLEDAGHPATEALLDRVRETLHAAVVDEDLGRRVRAGRLEKEERATGFGFASLPATTTKPRRSAPARRKRGEKTAQEAAAAARRDRAEEAARQKRQRAKESLRDARTALAEAERALRSRKRELEQAEREVGRREAAVESAKRALERLGR